MRAGKERTIQRLEQVIRVLQELPEGKKFQMGHWMECGTSGCAIGWSAMDPWFKRRGLKLELDEDTMDNRAYLYPSRSLVPAIYMPVYRGKEEFPAVADFFGISIDTADQLFMPRQEDGLNRRPAVIARIRRFIKELEKADA